MTDRFNSLEGLASLKVERADGIITVRFSRPGVMNAVDETMLGELGAVVQAIDADTRVRAAILIGEGKAFSAGADVNRTVAMTAEEGLAYRRKAHAILDAMERSRVVFIAALNGHALGGGLEIALACDIRIAARNAKVGFPELGVGLIPGWGGMQRLSRLAGVGWAKDMVLTGRRLDAEEAHLRGIISRVVEAEDLAHSADEIAQHIARLSPIGVRQAKRAIGEGHDMALSHALALDIEASYVNFASQDRVEGLKAFLEKRPPKFLGI